MDHRLPLILSLATGLGACQPDGEGSNAAPIDDVTTSTGGVDPRYTFTLDIDGDVVSLGAYYLNVVHATGSSCDESWRVSVSFDDSLDPTLLMVLVADEAFAVGGAGALDVDTPADRRSILSEHSGGDQLRSFHSPAWTLTDWGPDTLTVEIAAGSVCFGNDSVDCQPFDRATVQLVSASVPFEPEASWCRVDSSGDPGELCWGGNGPNAYNSEDEDGLYTPCP